MSFTIKGTRKRLCDTCTRGIVTVSSNGQTTIICIFGNPARVLNEEIVECTQFQSVLHKDEYELKEIAWILKGKGDKIGFESPKKREE